jgi:cell division protein FtsB
MDSSPFSREEQLAVVAELQRQLTALQRQVADLAAGNEALRAEIEQLKRG